MAKGYGRVAQHGRVRQVHVVIWESTHGPVPPGCDVDHVCHNRDRDCPGGDSCYHRACIAVEHLRLATRAENVRAGKSRTGKCVHGHAYEGNRITGGKCRLCHNEQSVAWRKAKRTHCPQGHAYDEENTLVNANGRRMCLICLRERAELMRSQVHL